MSRQSLAIEDSRIATGKPVLDLRGRLIAVCMITGFSIPALCWLAVLFGATREVFAHDQVAVTGVLFSVYAPLLAFINNKGENRSLEKQLLQFAFLTFFSNVGYQFFWEMPWFVIKEQIYATTITEADKWFWPWWAYGVADTRYLKPNELSISISGMDASVALLEVFVVLLFFKGYRLLACWFALIMGSCMGWGQYYFYMGEIYFHFANVEDGWFGFWIKYMVLNIPWLIFPFIAGAGFIWHIAAHYKAIGVREYLAGHYQSQGKDFHQDCYVFLKTDEDTQTLEQSTDMRLLKPVIYFAFCTPVLFLIIDIWRFYT